MMMDRPWTARPWKAFYKAKYDEWHVSASGWGLFPDGIDSGNREADARLIAASPDLFAALHEMTEVYWGVDDDKNGDGHSPPPECIIRARAALSKALGKE
jgi:hypothetical protein